MRKLIKVKSILYKNILPVLENETIWDFLNREQEREPRGQNGHLNNNILLSL